MEDHQIEIIDLDEDHRNISLSWFAHKTWSQTKVCYEKTFIYIKEEERMSGYPGLDESICNVSI